MAFSQKHLMSRIVFILILGALSYSPAAQSPISYFTSRNYTVHDGLVQMQVRCMFHDSRGYLWVGTQGGVSKFNGETFENLTAPDDLPHYYIFDIEEDNHGNIWIVSYGGLTKIDGVSATTYPNDIKREARMTIDDENRIWIISNKGQFLYFEKGEYHDLFGRFPELKDKRILDVYFNKAINELFLSIEFEGVYVLESFRLKKIFDDDFKNGKFFTGKSKQLYFEAFKRPKRRMFYQVNGTGFQKFFEIDQNTREIYYTS